MTRFAFAAVLLLLSACGDDSNPPADHTVALDSAMHMPGLYAPVEGCTECHGASLQGGSGPSCTKCHGVKW